MYEIAHGIDIHYDNNKNNLNIVLIQGKEPLQYTTTDLLLEVMSESSIFMLTEKVKTMIDMYPDKAGAVSRDSVTDSFRWLYGTVVDEELPVSTELFRSSFSNAIHSVCSKLGSYETMLDFLHSCYNEYMNDVNSFLAYFDALASYDSEIDNEAKNKYAEIFIDKCGAIMEVYKKKCSIRRKGDTATIWTYNITSFMDFLVFIYSRLSQEHRNVKICANCNRYFIPQKRSDEKYCMNPSPQDQLKTCKEVGANEKRKQKIRDNNELHEHNNNMCRLHNQIRRAKEAGDPQDMIDFLEAKLKKEKYKYFNT